MTKKFIILCGRYRFFSSLSFYHGLDMFLATRDALVINGSYPGFFTSSYEITKLPVLAVSRPISAKSCTPKWLKMIKGVVQPSRIMPHGKTFAISNMFQCVKWSTNKKSKIFPPYSNPQLLCLKKQKTQRGVSTIEKIWASHHNTGDIIGSATG